MTLKQLLPSQDIDAVLGDIAEEASRRSRIWYWSQLVAVVVVAGWRDTRTHPWLAIRAVATGVATLTAYFSTVMVIGRVIRVLSNGGYYVAGYLLTLPPRPLPPMPYDALTVVAINAFGFLISGWAIGRIYRTHGIAMAMPFLVMTTLAALVPLAIVATDTGPGTRTMPVYEFVAVFATLFISIPGGILAGAVLALRNSRRN